MQRTIPGFINYTWDNIDVSTYVLVILFLRAFFFLFSLNDATFSSFYSTEC